MDGFYTLILRNIYEIIIRLKIFARYKFFYILTSNYFIFFNIDILLYKNLKNQYLTVVEDN